MSSRTGEALHAHTNTHTRRRTLSKYSLSLTSLSRPFMRINHELKMSLLVVVTLSVLDAADEELGTFLGAGNGGSSRKE